MMSTDFKALCAELLDVIDSLPCETNYRNESRCVFSIDEDLDIGGWYDSLVGIETHSLQLREFFDKLGITEKDCIKAFKQVRPTSDHH